MLPINGHSLRRGCQKKLHSSLLTSVIGKHNNCTQTTGLSSHNWLTIPNLTNFRLPKMFIFLFFRGVPFKAWLKILITSKCSWLLRASLNSCSTHFLMEVRWRPCLLMARLNSCSIAVFETPDNQKVSCWNSSPSQKVFCVCNILQKEKGVFCEWHKGFKGVTADSIIVRKNFTH